MSAYRPQDPDETLTHSVDFTPWLSESLSPTDTIASASWSISPNTGTTVTDLGESGNIVSASVSGLTRRQLYRLTCDMVSVAGETVQKSIVIRCDDK